LTGGPKKQKREKNKTEEKNAKTLIENSKKHEKDLDDRRFKLYKE